MFPPFPLKYAHNPLVVRGCTVEEITTLVESVGSRITPNMSEDEIYHLALTIPLDAEKVTRTRGIRKARERESNAEIRRLKERVTYLEKALKEANRNGGYGPELWWQNAVFLASQEITLMERVMYQNEDLLIVAKSLGLTENQALSYIRSAFRKRRLEKSGGPVSG